jgi:hypothetical protein
MGLLNWIFDIYQQSRIESLKDDLRRSRYEAAALRSGSDGLDLDHLERAIGELALAVKSVQRILVEKGLCSASDLRQMIDRVDREDGRLDGRSSV